MRTVQYTYFMLCYIAYPTSLTLQSANALQTYATLRELRARRPDTLALMAHWGHEPSRFAELGVWHLPRPAIGRLSRLHRSSLWYYLEYSTFAGMCLATLRAANLVQDIEAIYVRQNICAAWLSALCPQIPVIYEAHDMEAWNPSRAREPWGQGFVQLIDRTALTRSAAVVSLTEQFRRYLRAIGWRSPDEVFVIPDGYDEELFVPQERAACRAALGLPPDAPVLAYAGMTFAHRWLDGLLLAVARLVATYPDLYVVLVGGRPAEVSALQQQAHALGIAERVLLPGPRPQSVVVQYLNAADVLVIPDTVTDMTASPLKLFEYLALGAPLVLPDLPALREIVAPALAHYFPRRSLDGLTDALAGALAATGNEVAVRARRVLARDYTYGRRAERILDVVGRVRNGA